MDKTIINIQKYFSIGTFVIPNYQRGYKWGVEKDGKNAVGVLIDDLIKAFKKNKNEYFIQGVTVYEENNNDKTLIFLVDGQQRTTTFYLLLKFLKVENLPEINYSIRQESNYVLNNCNIKDGELLFEKKEKTDYNLQDIHYFENTVRIFKSKLNEFDKENFKIFILEKVKLFYIQITKENATKVFSMLNGQKAIMKPDELIKADLLSKASKTIKTKSDIETSDLTSLLQLIKNKVGEEWEINSLRSKYAREWDKWLYWWNRKDIKTFFNSSDKPLGLLLEYYFDINKKKKELKYNFENFRNEFFTNLQNTKLTFKRLRDFQKTFEDWYYNSETYNYFGLILKGEGSKKEALQYFLNNKIKNKVSIEEYAKWILVNATHKQITNSSELKEDEDTKEDKAKEVLQQLSEKKVYGQHNNIALKQLLLNNVLLDIQLNRKFDFNVYGDKSLEHIYPKSWEKEEDSKLNFDNNLKDKLSVHCIGNLVLIKKNENSKFSNKSFDEKKSMYFNTDNALWSLKLLHSVSVFSKNEWNENSIAKNYNSFLNNFRKYYKIEDEK